MNMREICPTMLICLAVIAPSTMAATPAPVKEPTSITVKTANDLADSCMVAPTSKINFARLNFCTGFAQGILQTNGQNPNGSKICLPNPAPKRSDTMKEFATWVRADPSRRVQLASVGFLRFMTERFPCSKP